MVVQKYQVEKATIDKIKKLFAHRKLSNLLKASGLASNKEFVSDIINVQYQIYMLDGYLESQWELDKKKIALLWEAIEASLEAMGFSRKQISSMTKEIKDYERIERNMRKDKWPTKESFKDFYTTKSCDVRLVRHLIYNAFPDLGATWKEKAWRFYDIITEINDDIADVEEDILTLNGNRFLISVLRKGLDKTYNQYKEYLTVVSQKANAYFEEKADQGKNKQLIAWTMDSSLQTLKLLDQQVKNKNADKFSASLLLARMK